MITERADRSHGVTCLLPPDSTGSVCRTHTCVRVTAGHPVSWKAKCSKAVSELWWCHGVRQRKPCWFFSCTRCKCVPNATLVSGTLTFHIIHIYLTCQLAVPFVLPHLFPSKQSDDGWMEEKINDIFGVNKKKISNLVTIMLFQFFFIRPRQKDAMTVWCSDLYIPQKKERNADLEWHEGE